ncbi:MAG: GatB/YqeY domain-containing protein [Salibacteraceae bacterium]
MSVAAQINQDIKKAMLAKDKKRLEALRAIKSAILLIASAKAGSEVSDEDAIMAMHKLVKQRKDAAGIYTEQGRSDMAQDEQYQAGVIEEYLPAMMDESEIRTMVLDQIKTSGASGPQDMGKVMGPLTSKLKGKADGKLISQIVKDELGKL